MSNELRLEGDFFVAGTLSARTMGIPSATVVDDDVAAAADIAASKLEQQYVQHYSQENDTASVTEDHTIHCVQGATGTIQAFQAGACTACGDDGTIEIDLCKNGVTTSLLDAVITLNSSSTAWAASTATIDTATLTVGDVLQVTISADTGTGGTCGKGVFATCKIREDPD